MIGRERRDSRDLGGMRNGKRERFEKGGRERIEKVIRERIEKERKERYKRELRRQVNEEESIKEIKKQFHMDK